MRRINRQVYARRRPTCVRQLSFQHRNRQALSDRTNLQQKNSSKETSGASQLPITSSRSDKMLQALKSKECFVATEAVPAATSASVSFMSAASHSSSNDSGMCSLRNEDEVTSDIETEETSVLQKKTTEVLSQCPQPAAVKETVLLQNENTESAVMNLETSSSINLNTSAEIAQATPIAVSTPVAALPANALGDKSAENPGDVTVSGLASNNTPPGSVHTSLHSQVPPATPHITDPNQSGKKRKRDDDESLEPLFDVKSILMKTQDGRLVLKWYRDRGYLGSKKRGILVDILIKNELEEDPSKRVSPQRFTAMADGIGRIFPRETAGTYFQKYFVDEFGKPHNARGKLYDRYCNIRRDFRAEGLIAKRGASNIPGNDFNPNGDSNGEQLTSEVKTLLALTQNLTEPKETVIECFEKTCPHRINDFLSKKPKDVYTNFIRLYVALHTTDGYTLIDRDFEIIHPGKGHSLFTKWEGVKTNILKLANTLSSSSKSYRDLLKSLSIDLTLNADEWCTINSIALLAASARTLTVKKKWRPTKFEAKDGLIIVARSKEEIQGKIERRDAKLLLFADLKGIPVPAVIVSPENQFSYFVYFRNFCYECPSVLKSIDICMKLFILLELIPQDSLLPWLFLKTYVYSIPSDAELLYPSLKTLWNDITTS